MAARATGNDAPGEAAPLLLYAVKQVELAVRAHLDELLRPAGITALQYTALTVLDRRDGLTSAELARNSFVTPQAMRDLVTALEKRDLIARRHDPAHRRRLLIALTPAGQALLAQTRDEVGALEERMLDGLSDAERRAFRDYLNRARTALAGGPAQ
ncbi:MarR family winged helix-turn-helix transcriptional regulator [Embleya scabrispora]|uniref:MarR family winged helix-turn-helix transcriptional regulator n=1 Tax=Embleya scabrispora TaxID=159449 RepID=UPI00036368C9|nr:MarR family transcriptional regulator [Embleya scabrispora]MYS86277.1 MarR family transcriptional regulator [Streptomyces sp. SID5474]